MPLSIVVEDDVELREAQNALTTYLYGEKQKAIEEKHISLIRLLGTRIQVYKKGMSTLYKGKIDVIKVSNGAVMLRRLPLRSAHEIRNALAIMDRNQVDTLRSVQALKCPLLGAIRWAVPAVTALGDVVCAQCSLQLEEVDVLNPTMVAQVVFGLMYMNSFGMAHNDAVVRNIMCTKASRDHTIGPVIIAGQPRYLTLYKGDTHAVIIDFNLSSKQKEITKHIDLNRFVRDVLMRTEVRLCSESLPQFLMLTLGGKLV